MAEFKVLTEREHILERPNMYIGQTTRQEYKRLIGGKFKNIVFSQGLIKITNEIIDNSLDEFLRSDMKFATKINITVDKSSFRITDNGRGIPVERYGDFWKPVLCWTQTKAGTSFSDERVGAGANGLGSVAANIFSRKFIGESHDGKNVCTVECEDNMTEIKVFTRSSKKRGCSVYTEPDFTRFGCDSYSEDDIAMLRERIVAVASANPEITFTFNSEVIKCKKSSDYMKSFGDEFVLHDTSGYFIGVLPSNNDEYIQYSVIDGLEFHSGGTHEEYISKGICNELRTLIKKAYKIDMTPSEIKRGLFLVINGRCFENMMFDSQTKERLTNTEAHVKKYFGAVPFLKIATNIMKKEEIIQPIIQTKLAKQAAVDARALTLAQKKLKQVNVLKHTKANSKNRSECVLLLTEGDSAAGMAKKVRNTETEGIYPLKGMPLNTFSASNKEIIENEELKNIMNIMGLTFDNQLYKVSSKKEIVFCKKNDEIKVGPKWLSFDDITKKPEQFSVHKSSDEKDFDVYYTNVREKLVRPAYNYGGVGILVDADTDGTGGIMPLVVCFFSKWKELFESKQLYFISTPLVIENKGKSKKYFYSMKEYEDSRSSLKGYNIKYLKGLGSLVEVDYRFALENKDKWYVINIDDEDVLRIMFDSKAIQERKDIMSV